MLCLHALEAGHAQALTLVLYHAVAGVAGGAGFNELAGYIFGGNEGKVKMEMTTPVFTETSPGQAAASMQFVLEPRCA